MSRIRGFETAMIAASLVGATGCGDEDEARCVDATITPIAQVPYFSSDNLTGLRNRVPPVYTSTATYFFRVLTTEVEVEMQVDWASGEFVDPSDDPELCPSFARFSSSGTVTTDDGTLDEIYDDGVGFFLSEADAADPSAPLPDVISGVAQLSSDDIRGNYPTEAEGGTVVGMVIELLYEADGVRRGSVRPAVAKGGTVTVGPIGEGTSMDWGPRR